MISRDADRIYTFVVALCVAVAFAACGGGGNGSSGGAAEGSTATPTGKSTSKPGTSTPTRRTTPGTPTPPPSGTVTPPIIVPSGRSILSYVRNAPSGSTVVVSPGKYTPFTLAPSDLQGPITLLADVTGTISESGAGPVIIDAAFGQSHPAAAAITLSGIPEADAVVIDGFTLRNATRAGIAIDYSPGTTVENCTLESNTGDGARFTGSDASLLFNNLAYNNSGVGVHALGTNALSVFNNTVYNNTGTGISIGSDLDASDASPNAVVENNVINSNSPFGIAVAANSTDGYTGDYNLNSDGYAGTAQGPNDLVSNVSAIALFISPTSDPPDLHLSPDSPAIDAADPATPAGLVSLLQDGTTQANGAPDCGPPDLGYHYPAIVACGQPTPTPTRAR